MSTQYAVWRGIEDGLFHAASEKHAARKPLELHDSIDSARRAAAYYNSIGRYAPAAAQDKQPDSEQDELFSA